MAAMLQLDAMEQQCDLTLIFNDPVLLEKDY